MKKLTQFLIACLLLCSTIACTQSKADQIDALIAKYHEYNQFTGSVLVADHGKVIYKKGFGLANRNTNITNGPDTRHRLASVTKQFTAMAIMQLVAAGKLSLEAPVSAYIKSYPNPPGNQITIHHLLTHTSGIPNYTSFPNYRELMGKSMTSAQLVDLFKNEALEFTPGNQFAYSNSGYVLLGHIIETVTGKSYAEVVKENIFNPLKMKNSGYDGPGNMEINTAIGYNQAGAVFTPADFIDMSVPHAAGALFSSVEDMHLWNEAQYTEKLLSKKYLDMMVMPHISANQQHYGYGWEIDELPVGNSGERINTISHSGGINGFVTENVRIPEEQSAIILLSNATSSYLQEILVAINGILHDKTYDAPKRSVAYAVLGVIQKDGIDKAITFYNQAKEDETYYLNEGEMNNAGYQLLQAGKLKEAAVVFKCNVDAFPKAFNVYDSYGEVLLALGDSAQSIVNYKKSLEINPFNEYGIKALRSMGVDPDSFIRKVAPEKLQLLAGDYVSRNEATGKEWKISFTVENGILTGNDRGYRYKLAPQSDTEFINPDDGAVLKFDTRDAANITLELFGFTFKKV